MRKCQMCGCSLENQDETSIGCVSLCMDCSVEIEAEVEKLVEERREELLKHALSDFCAYLDKLSFKFDYCSERLEMSIGVGNWTYAVANYMTTLDLDDQNRFATLLGYGNVEYNDGKVSVAI